MQGAPLTTFPLPGADAHTLRGGSPPSIKAPDPKADKGRPSGRPLSALPRQLNLPGQT